VTIPNAALAYRVLDHIDAHPEQHDQNVWVEEGRDCGTAACLAGWAVLLSGDEPIFDDDEPPQRETNEVLADGSILPVWSRAADLLRIDPDGGPEGVGGYRLFSQHNTRDDLGRLITEIFGPRPTGLQ
jgi:hypothetical protein